MKENVFPAKYANQIPQENYCPTSTQAPILTFICFCITLKGMKNTSITIRLDDNLEKILSDVCATSGKSRSEIVREALRRQLQVYKFNQLRNRAVKYAEKAGLFTDEDIFKIVS